MNQPAARSFIEIVVTAIEAGKAHRILRFNHGTQEGSPDRFYLVDCRGHLERVPCSRCGVKPVVKWSTDRLYPTVDAYESVQLGCPQCFRYVELHCLADDYGKSRGPMANALSGWWNVWQDKDYHPSDFEAAGGVILNAQVLEEHFLKLKRPDEAASQTTEPTTPPPPETV